SVAASTGIMDLRTNQWRQEMLDALERPEYRKLAWNQLPKIVDQVQPLGALSESLAVEAGIALDGRPLIFPTSDDQQAGLVGGGAVDAGQMAIILGSSAVVNSSSSQLPSSGNLDVMKLNWGPYLWMRCYNNGAQFLNTVLGPNPPWDQLEKEGRDVPPGAGGTLVSPYVYPEPSRGITKPRLEWTPAEPREPGKKYRAALEALAYLIAHGVREHEEAGQKVNRITVSGGLARSALMCEILASVLDQPLERLQSEEGPALGAAVTALAALETYLRRKQGIATPFTVADAAPILVKFRGPIAPNPRWRDWYRNAPQLKPS